MAKGEYSWPVIGHEQAIGFLESALDNHKIAQTYVFSGLDDLGKSLVALAFAKNLQGEQAGFNTDLHILEPAPDKKSLPIEAVRDFIKLLNLSSFSNSYKIGIIRQADLLTAEAQSALLKTLEEPKDKVVIILLTADENRLQSTILSRSQILYFYPVPAAVIYDYLLKNYNAPRSLAKDLANLALGRPLYAQRLWEHPADYQSYLEHAGLWLSLTPLDFNGRLRVLDQIFKDKTWSKAAVELAEGIIMMAEGLSRDLLLLTLDQPDRVQHSALRPALEDSRKFLNSTSGNESGPLILKQLKLLAQAREYLAANVNPHLVLEQVVLNW